MYFKKDCVHYGRIEGTKLIFVSADTEWTDLESSLAEPDPEITWNVEQVRISGSGIELLQRFHQYDPPRHGKGGALEVETDHYRWQVIFNQGQFRDVVVREYERPRRKCLFVELRFMCTAAPYSADATLRATRESASKATLSRDEENLNHTCVTSPLSLPVE